MQPVHKTATYRCDDTRGCVMQFWPSDKHMWSKHVEAWNKLTVKQKFCASSWLITETNTLRCTVSKSVKKTHNRYNKLISHIAKIKLWKRIILGYKTVRWIWTRSCILHISLCTINHDNWHYQGHSISHDKYFFLVKMSKSRKRSTYFWKQIVYL